MTREREEEIAKEAREVCQTCLGGGEIIVGWAPKTWVSPPEPIFDECPVCWGLGSLRKWEREEMFDEWPTEEEAREMHERKHEARMWEAAEARGDVG